MNHDIFQAQGVLITLLEEAALNCSYPQYDTQPGEQPAEEPAGPVAEPRRRKRGPSVPQQVKQLESQREALQLALQQEEEANARVNARLKVVELIIQTKDEHVARVHQVQQDDFDDSVFDVLRISREGLKHVGHTWIVERYLAISNDIGLQLAEVLPALQRNPDAFQRLMHSPSSTAGVPEVDLPAQQAQHVTSFLQSVLKLLHSFQWIFFVNPILMLSGSMHVDTAEVDTAPANTAVKQDSSMPGICPGSAPESHWRELIPQLHLSDQQRLHSTLLYEIISKAHAGVLQQRAATSRLMSEALQRSQQVPGDDATANKGKSGAPQLDVKTAGTQCVWKDAQQLEYEAKLLETLDKTVLKERALLLLAGEVLFHHVLSPLQSAITLVRSYPYIPDDMAILYAIASDDAAV